MEVVYARVARTITTNRKCWPSLRAAVFSRSFGNLEGETMESEHDNYSRNTNKTFHNKQKTKIGNIRNFKPVENHFNYTRRHIDPKHITASPKSQFIYGRACVYAALVSNQRKKYKLFVNQSFQQQQDEEEKSNSHPEGYKSFSMQECINLAQAKHIPIERCSRHHLNSLSDHRPNQGVILEASEIHYIPITNLENLDNRDEKTKQFPLWVALDQIWDPQNFGSIVRCCYYFGVAGLVITEHNSPLTPAASRASAGALEVFPIYFQRYLNKFIGESQKQGWHVIGASVTSYNNIPTVSAKSITLDKPTILILGNESFGLRDKIARYFLPFFFLSVFLFVIMDSTVCVTQ
eukprot:Phypoly_transcript_09877.p1 GENE.Phypoly_transcript_09877~~Phypoly_transcript_09877.p1  ORF type:complete len:349 (+),score=22.49 Phypoly_transcript_09877:203-1249(+)